MTKEKVKVTWQVDDHYAGGSRPQHTYIDVDEFDGCETKEEFMEVVSNAVQDDYDQLGFFFSDIDWNDLKVPEDCHI